MCGFGYLVFTPLFLGSSVGEVVAMLLPAIIPFNLLYAALNGAVTLLSASRSAVFCTACGKKLDKCKETCKILFCAKPTVANENRISSYQGRRRVTGLKSDNLPKARCLNPAVYTEDKLSKPGA